MAIQFNFLIKYRKLYITLNEQFVPIEKAYPKLKVEFNRLELDKSLDIATKNEQLAHLILEWGLLCDTFRTLDWAEIKKENIKHMHNARNILHSLKP